MKLLIAEDTMSARLMLQAVATRSGFDIVLAEDGQQAWDVLNDEDAPRLALLDWEMPHLDGLEICRRVRAVDRREQPYILLLTGRQDAADIAKGLEAGADDYVFKPFDSVDLQTRLRTGRRMLSVQKESMRAMHDPERGADRDRLTGLLNHAAVMRALERQLVRARLDDLPLHIGLLGVGVPEQAVHGHHDSVGEVLLRELATRLLSKLRCYDLAGRCDGGTFLLLINGGVAHAPILFDGFRRAMSDTPVSYKQRTWPIGLSCGVASFVPPKDTRDATQLFAAADAALEKSRAGGRKEITFAPMI